MLVGSVAALMYGRNRSTDDIDIVLDCTRVNPERLSNLFEPEYMLDPVMVADSVRRGIMFNAIPLTRGPKVDLIPVKPAPFEREAFRRRQQRDWHGTPVSVIAPDDLVIAKLSWAKESQSERQLADVRAIMAMDIVDESDDHFQHWVSSLGLEATLDASRSTRYEA